MARAFLPIFPMFLFLASMLHLPSPAHAQGTGVITLGKAKLRVKMPKGWLSAKPHDYLTYEVFWHHPQGARLAIASRPRTPQETLETWVRPIRKAAQTRKITLQDPAGATVARQPAMRIVGASRTHEVQFVVFFHQDQAVMVQFSCERKDRAGCAFRNDFEQVLSSMEP